MRIKRLNCLAALTILLFIVGAKGKAQQTVAVETLKQFVSAFNAHDLDADWHHPGR